MNTTTHPFWEVTDHFLFEAPLTTSVDELLTLTRASFPGFQSPEHSCGDAFFPGSGGNEQLIEVIGSSMAWSITWVAADYHWKARDRAGATVEYIEGDLYRR